MGVKAIAVRCWLSVITSLVASAATSGSINHPGGAPALNSCHETVASSVGDKITAVFVGIAIAGTVVIGTGIGFVVLLAL